MCCPEIQKFWAQESESPSESESVSAELASRYSSQLALPSESEQQLLWGPESQWALAEESELVPALAQAAQSAAVEESLLVESVRERSVTESV